MLTIRLARVGKKKQPQYRVVVADHRRAVTGRFVDVVGHVNPLTDPATISLKNEKVNDWLSKGARPSETVQTILIRENILKAPAKRAKRASKVAKNPDKYGKAAPAAEAPAESAEPASQETPQESSDQATPADEAAEASQESQPDESQPETTEPDPAQEVGEA